MWNQERKGGALKLLGMAAPTRALTWEVDQLNSNLSALSVVVGISLNL